MYLLVNKLYKLFTRIGLNIEYKIFKIINKLYYYFSIKNKSFWYLKFTLMKNIDFNYTINIDIIYLNENPIFHIVNTTIVFQIKQFLNNILAKKI